MCMYYICNILLFIYLYGIYVWDTKRICIIYIYRYRMNGGCPNSWIIMDSAIKIGNLGVSPF